VGETFCKMAGSVHFPSANGPRINWEINGRTRLSLLLCYFLT
jgi:hypothetical protein